MPMPEHLEQSRTFTRRLMLLMGVQGLALSGLVARIYQLQVSDSTKYSTLAEENRINTRLLVPPRGEVFDRHGRPLAVNEEYYRVFMVAEKLGDVERVLGRLAGIIELDPEAWEQVLRDAKQKRRFLPITIASGLTWDEVAQIEVNAPDLPGIQTEKILVRRYPFGELVSHLVGYVGPADKHQQARDPDPLLRLPEFRIGKSGIESKYDMKLRGRRGVQRVEINASGRVQREIGRNEGKPGEDLYTTIDTTLQRKALSLLQPHLAASIVVMDIHTGDVLVMASTPGYDPNLLIRRLSGKTWRALRSSKLGPFHNRAIAGQYAPGSTFKMVVALAGLDTKSVKSTTKFTCNGVFQMGKANFHCWNRRGHGPVAMREALRSSCDVYFYKLALEIGIDQIAETANRLGIGVSTGIGLPAEKRGLMPTKAWKHASFRDKPDQIWQRGETAIAGIGQGFVLATPLQLAVMTARLANGGYAVTPRLITNQPSGYQTAHQLASSEFRSLGFQIAHLDTIKDAMSAATNERAGTAFWTRITDKGFEMAGKTGTSQVRRITAAERARGVISNDRLPWHRRDHALFVAYAPKDDPRFACAVIVEHGGSGSKVAAPLAKEILLEAQKRYGIRSDRVRLDDIPPHASLLGHRP
ncbi:MAG: penicillin-binding protein 2 [Rhodospirillaceae bacterium]|nr:penicillin-binding protein 2 [Rhodospirillaceae bacterium]